MMIRWYTKWIWFKRKQLIYFFIINIILTFCVILIFYNVENSENLELKDYLKTHNILNDSEISFFQSREYSLDQQKNIKIDIPDLSTEIRNYLIGYFNIYYDIKIENINIFNSIRSIALKQINSSDQKSNTSSMNEIFLTILPSNMLPSNSPNDSYTIHSFNELNSISLNESQYNLIIRELADISNYINSNSIFINEDANITTILMTAMTADNNLNVLVTDFFQIDYGTNFPWNKLLGIDTKTNPENYILSFGSEKITFLNEHEKFIHGFLKQTDGKQERSFLIILPLLPLSISLLFFSNRFYLNFINDRKFIFFGNIHHNNLVRYVLEGAISYSPSIFLIIYGLYLNAFYKWILVLYGIVSLITLFVPIVGKINVKAESIFSIASGIGLFGIIIGLSISIFVNLDDKLINILFIFTFISFILPSIFIIFRLSFKKAYWKSPIKLKHIMLNNKALVTIILTFLVINFSLFNNWEQEEIFRSNQVIDSGHSCMSNNTCVAIEEYNGKIENVNITFFVTDIEIYSKILIDLSIHGISSKIKNSKIKDDESIFLSTEASRQLNWKEKILRATNISVANETYIEFFRPINIFKSLPGLYKNTNWIILDNKSFVISNLVIPINQLEIGSDKELFIKRISNFFIVSENRRYSTVFKVIQPLTIIICLFTSALILFTENQRLEKIKKKINITERNYYLEKNNKKSFISKIFLLDLIMVQIVSTLGSLTIVTASTNLEKKEIFSISTVSPLIQGWIFVVLLSIFEIITLIVFNLWLFYRNSR